MWAHIYDGPNDDVVCEVSAVYVSVCVCVNFPLRASGVSEKRAWPCHESRSKVLVNFVLQQPPGIKQSS